MRYSRAVESQPFGGLPEVPADHVLELAAARLAETLHMLREHILKEQDGVFPAALAGLRIADWEAVEAIRDRVGSLLPSPDR